MNNTTWDTYIEMCHYGGSSTLFIVKNFPLQKYVVSQSMFCIVNCFLIIPTVLLNGISVITIARNNHLKGKLCYFLILIQSFIDLAVGIITLPLYIFNAASELFGNARCSVFVSLEGIAFTPLAVSFATSLLLTFERYMSILHPIAHRCYLTKTKMIAFCCGNLGICVLTGPIFRIFFEDSQSIFQIILVLSLLVLHTLGYARIYLAVRNMHFANDAIGDYSSQEALPNSAEKRKSLRERKLAFSCALVVIINYICYLPFLFSYLYFKKDFMSFRIATSWCTMVALLISSLNSLVFFWKRPILRQEAMKLLRKMSND